MDTSRREFLKAAGLAVIGTGGGLAYLGGRAASSSEPGHGEATALDKQWGMVINLEKCQGETLQTACAEVCHREHNVPSIPDTDDEIKWIWDEPFANAFPDQIHPHTAPAVRNMPVLVLCNHCTDPACVQVCPTQATWRRESDGIVMMDMHRCIGCRYCMAACPYGSRSFNFRDPEPYMAEGYTAPFPARSIGVVEKCNFCAERLRAGQEPACVEVARDIAGEGAIVFGDLADPESEVSRLLQSEHTIVRKVTAGTGPNVFYIV